MIGKKGLFGKKPYGMAEMPGAISGFGGGTFNMDGTQATPMQQEITYTPKAQAIMSGEAPMPKPRSFWQGGDRFTGRDALAGALAAIGDGLSNWAGNGGGAVGNLLQSRMEPQRLAEQQRQRAMELADFRTQMQIRQEYREPTEFERALALGGIDPNSLEGRDLARQRATRMAQGPDPLLQGAPLPGGGTYTGPFSGYAGMARGGQAPSTPDTLPPDFFDNPGGGRPMQAPAQPIRGARTITRQEYNRILQSMNGDQRRMNAWMTQNNVVAGN